MAARKTKIRHDEETRTKIQTSQLINRLTDHALGRCKMEASAVSAALGLLRKAIPDLSSAEVKTESTIHYVARMPAKTGSMDEWRKQYAPSPAQNLQ